MGWFLADECARRGLRWRLVEANAEQSSQSKALAIFPRTLEILDMAGLVEPFMRVANRVTSVAVIARGHPLARGGNGIRGRFLLLVDEELDRPVREAAQRLVAAFPGVLELRTRRGADIALIRSDGYVAYGIHGGRPIAALDRVRTLLERQNGSRTGSGAR